MSLKSFIFLIIAIFLASCSSTIKVAVKYADPTQQSIPSDVKSISILTYEYNASNPKYKFLQNSMPDQIADAIIRYGTYQVVDREHIKTLITEAQINASDDMDDEAIEKLNHIETLITEYQKNAPDNIDDEAIEKECKIANVQAIIVGKINNVSIEEHMEQKDFPYLVRRVTVDITSEMFLTKTKRKIITDHFRKTYDSEKDKNVISNTNIADEKFYQSQPTQVPTVSSILTNFIEEASQSFINKIFPNPVVHWVNVYTGKNPAIQIGIDWIKHDNYSRAIESFHEATNDPDEAGIAWYNMGVCYEYLQQNREAEEAYNKALKYGQISDAKEGISRLQRYSK